MGIPNMQMDPAAGRLSHLVATGDLMDRDSDLLLRRSLELVALHLDCRSVLCAGSSNGDRLGIASAPRSACCRNRFWRRVDLLARASTKAFGFLSKKMLLCAKLSFILLFTRKENKK